ncbi:hypothetical protein CUU66_12640 [Peribacillus deserti]|uniref:Uncharacterized protein n=1 Tax=Peribacillus deserti TaxID=673318 RepID=A0A2N5M5C6_9BACI|nr:hypothetical protein CUU66_12640 [Peribacillus deserti]
MNACRLILLKRLFSKRLLFFNKFCYVTLLFSQGDWSVRCETPAGAVGIVRLQRLDPPVISQSVHRKENRFPRPACLMLVGSEQGTSAFLSGEIPQAKPRRLTARPAESEHPGAEINLLFNSSKVCENSLL